MDTHQPLKHPVLVIIRGLPGTGKTYLANALIKELDADEVLVLDPDSIDQKSEEYVAHVKAQEAEGVDPKLHLYRFSRAKAYAGIETNKIIVWNQPFTNLEAFGKVIDRLKEHAVEVNTTLPIMVVEVALDPQIAYARVTERIKAGGHGPSEGVFTRYSHEYETLANHGYDVVTVDGQQDIAKSVDAVLERLPEFMA